MVRIGVIGAGVNGLSSALNLQRAYPHARVTIIADQLGSETLSYGVGGLFRPDINALVSGDNGQVIKQCLRDSWKHFASLAMSDQAKDSGHMLVPGLSVHRTDMESGYEIMKECSFFFHQISEHDMRRRGIPAEFKYAYSCTTVISQPNLYMDWLMKQFKSRGGQIQRRRVEKLEELYGQFELVVNCCGLRAKTFLGDQEVFPSRGQIALVKAPWIKHFHYFDTDVYLIPHFDKIVVGGIRIHGDGNEVVDPKVTRTILDRAEAIFPELKGAELVASWAGARPYRSRLRLEIEILPVGNNKRLPVIHNYGHGGNGVTLSWGSGVQVARLAKDALAAIPKASL